ncbi:MAG: hypothetical protein IPJ04_08550 [Candidatus Eisenbacteria bacterium]|nr:hypothetical protein [Candidatus Eisenbacteria bacterium]
MQAALVDSLPVARQREYDFQHREPSWRCASSPGGAVAMLTSPRRPKQEETPRYDQPAGVLGAPTIELDAEINGRSCS